MRVIPRTEKHHQPEISIIKSLREPNLKQWSISLAIAGISFVALFSQFFTNFSGPNTTSAPHSALRNGLTAGFQYWSNQQSTGARGDSRWHYYLSMLIAYEWAILFIALFGSGNYSTTHPLQPNDHVVGSRWTHCLLVGSRTHALAHHPYSLAHHYHRRTRHSAHMGNSLHAKEKKTNRMFRSISSLNFRSFSIH